MAGNLYYLFSIYKSLTWECRKEASVENGIQSGSHGKKDPSRSNRR